MSKEYPELTHDKIQAELANLMAETAKLNAETSNLNRDTNLMPLKIFSAALATFIALGYVVLKFSNLINNV